MHAVFIWRAVAEQGSGHRRVFLPALPLPDPACHSFTAYFFPLFRWNTQYFATSPCCGTVYAVDREIGRQLERGEPVVLLPQHLQIVQPGTVRRTCAACGARVPQDAAFCPRCGKPLR